MSFVPGWLIATLTFPGVIVHELAHQLFCRLFRVAVLEVCYFRFGNPSGFVVHEPPRTAGQNILIGIGPFLVNSILSPLIMLPVVVNHTLGGRDFSPHELLLAWLGLSVGMHAFPSTGDAASIWRSVWEPGSSLVARLISLPLVVLIYLGALGSVIWLDLIYGLLVGLYLPSQGVRALAGG